MALFFGEESQAPLVDSSTSQAVKRRMNEFVGLLLFALAGALALALATYDVTDPSHFSATARTPSNWLGHPGAIVADAMMQVIGLSSWAVVLGLVAWGARFFFHIAPYRWLLRLPAVPIALILAMVFASLHPPYPGWPLSTGLGGLLGDSGVTAFLALMPIVPGLGSDEDIMVQALTLSVAAALLITMMIALGLTLRETGQILRWMVRSCMNIVGGLFGAIGGTAKAAARAATAPRARVEPAAEPKASRPATAQPVEEPKAEEPSAGGGFALPRIGLPKISLPSFGRSAADEEDDPLDPTRPVRREPSVAGDGDGAAERRALADSIRRLKGAQDEMPEDETPADRIRGFDDENDAPKGMFGRRGAASVETGAKAAKKSRRAKAEAQPDLFDGSAANYQAPPLALLEQAGGEIREHHSEAALEENARMLETVLEDYGVRGEIVAVKAGPVVTLYELEPAPGLKASRVIGLADDIARSMSALSARVSTVPGRSVIGIELPNASREKVLLRELLEAAAYGDGREKLALALGKDISGGPVVADLAKMPHLLIAGTTGSGKSVAINTMILSLLYRLSPQECRLIMIDPKMLELSVYDNIPHLMAPVVTDPKKALVALKWVVAEMEERYRKMSKMGVRNIEGYNARVRDANAKGEEFSRTIQTGFDEATGEPVYETETFEPEEMPFIVVIVDEMADLMMVAGKEIEACIQRLAQMARASGIHLIMATQRPSVDVITGTIKANFPTRVSFQVTSKIDSRTILGEQGAEQLLGQGDMLYMAGGGRITRVHGPFVSDEEVEEVVSHLKSLGAPSYVDAVTEGRDDETERMVDQKLGLAPAGDGEDALYDQAVAIVARDRKCSTSYIQRKLAIGYNKAARLVEQMEDQGVVSAANAVGKREILIEER